MPPQAASLPHTKPANSTLSGTPSKQVDWAFRILLLYIFIDYGRPMDQIPFLGYLHPGMIVIIILAVTWLGSSRKARARSTITTWFTLFIIWMAALGPFAVNNYWAFHITKAMGFLYLAHLCMLSFIDTPGKLRKVYLFWVLISVYLGILGITNKGKAGSYFLGDENDFCLLMVTLLPFSYFPLVRKSRGKRKLLYIVGLVTCLGAIVASKSRGGFLGLLAVAGYCWWVSPRKGRALAWAALGILVLVIFAGPTYWEEIRTIRDPGDYTRKARVNTWKAACRLFLDNPLGVGAGSFGYSVHGYDVEFLERDRTIAGRAAHSVYFTLLPELGVPGVIIFSGIVIACFRGAKGIRKDPGEIEERDLYLDVSLAAAAGIVGVLAAGAFISVLYYPHLWYLCGLIAVTRNFSNPVSSAVPGTQGYRNYVDTTFRQPISR